MDRFIGRLRGMHFPRLYSLYLSLFLAPPIFFNVVFFFSFTALSRVLVCLMRFANLWRRVGFWLPHLSLDFRELFRSSRKSVVEYEKSNTRKGQQQGRSTGIKKNVARGSRILTRNLRVRNVPDESSFILLSFVRTEIYRS